ncbi:MAG: tRNA-(ms[2]io[6]A)-hydroxylase, partial [uncultured Phycisphaerae bacterium]
DRHARRRPPAPLRDAARMGEAGHARPAGAAERPRAPGEEGGDERAGAVEPVPRAQPAGELGGGHDRRRAGRGRAPGRRVAPARPAGRPPEPPAPQRVRQPAPRPRPHGHRPRRARRPPDDLRPDRGPLLRTVQAPRRRVRRGRGHRRPRTRQALPRPLGQRARPLPHVHPARRANPTRAARRDPLGRDARRRGQAHRRPTAGAADAQRDRGV